MFKEILVEKYQGKNIMMSHKKEAFQIGRLFFPLAERRLQSERLGDSL
jgi:hypothetical protein